MNTVEWLCKVAAGLQQATLPGGRKLTAEEAAFIMLWLTQSLDEHQLKVVAGG